MKILSLRILLLMERNPILCNLLLNIRHIRIRLINIRTRYHSILIFTIKSWVDLKLQEAKTLISLNKAYHLNISLKTVVVICNNWCRRNSSNNNSSLLLSKIWMEWSSNKILNNHKLHLQSQKCSEKDKKQRKLLDNNERTSICMIYESAINC